MMKVTILGCGGSGGVPLAGGEEGEVWGACNPHNPKNRRTRTSAIIQMNGKTILIDTSPDLRQQLLRHKIQKIDAVLYTHAHADHCHGIDDLRSLSFIRKKSIPAYMSRDTHKHLMKRFDYAFTSGHQDKSYLYPPIMEDIIFDGPIDFKELEILPFQQDHGNMQTTGYRIGPVAYSTDVVTLSDKAFDVLDGIGLWVLDCLRFDPHPTHSHLAQSLEWIERVGVKKGVLIHMNHSVDYDAMLEKCPPHVQPAYDGLVIRLD